MSRPYTPPAAGHYRLTAGLRIIQEEQGKQGGLALCRYPLRVVRLSQTATRMLLLCQQQCTCKQLAQQLDLPIKRLETLCEQLRWKGLLEAGPTVAPPQWPSISIIIPSYNRAAMLERTLRSLFALDYPASCLEIIVVDDASTDETSAILERFVQEQEAGGHLQTLRFVRHTQRQGVAKSRNSGAEVAHHDLLAYIDSDCVASPAWLKELVPAFQDARVGAVGGLIRAYERQSILGRYEDVRSSLFMGVRPQQVSLVGPLTYLPTANLLVRRQLWQQLGGFAPLTFGEDVDFCRRLLATNFQILYLPQGTVAHDYRTHLWAFLRIRVFYASAEAALLKRHPGERRILILPPEQATFAGLALAGIWGILWSGTRWIARRKGFRGSAAIVSLLSTLFIACAFLLTLFGGRKRLHKVRQQRIPLRTTALLWPTLRGHLAYVYHLCRHVTRYYTLPLLLIGMLLPPVLLLTLLLCGIVIGVDYVRLRPDMELWPYALCSLLDDCAYEIGVLWGCIKHRNWKPLVPIIRRDGSR